MLLGVLEETPAAGSPGWGVRVVPNKYPALRPGDDVPVRDDFPWVSMPGLGHHEVVVETPCHDAEPESMDRGELAAVLRVFRRRYAVLITRPGIEAVVVFRNRGPQGGASLAHPHAQVIASGLVPPRLAAVRDWAGWHHAETDRCVTCEVLERELAVGERVVEATTGFAALVPFAATAPFELRIVPLRHQGAFAEASDAELAELAEVLGRSLRRLNAALGDPSYNYVIDSGTAKDAGAPHAHWSLSVVPGTSRPGGFEVGGGLPINPSLPEADATALRAAPACRDGEGGPGRAG